MARFIQLEHVIEVPDEETINTFAEKFIAWIEENGWTTGGSMQEVDENGDPTYEDPDAQAVHEEVLRFLRAKADGK